MFKTGSSIDEIAEFRELKVSTILNHLVKKYEDGAEIDLHQFVSTNEMASIKKLREELGNPNELKPYFEALEENVPYEKLRVALAILNKEG